MSATLKLLMGKKKKAKAEIKKWRKVALSNKTSVVDLSPPKACKSKCCKKYKKGEQKRCKRCPCFDLLKKVA